MKKLLIIAMIVGSVVLAPHFLMLAADHSMSDMDAACQTVCFSLGDGTAVASDFIMIAAVMVFFGIVFVSAVMPALKAENIDVRALWMNKRRHRYFLKSVVMLQ